MALGKDESSESFCNYVKRKLKNCLKIILDQLLLTPDQEGTDIIPEGEREFCGICLSTKRKSAMFTTRKCNSHSYCGDCVALYVTLKIKEKKAWIKCPHFSCKQFLTPQDCSTILPRRLLEPWEVNLVRVKKKSRREIRCPFNDCSALVMVVYAGGGPEVEATNRRSRDNCPGCGRRICEVCYKPRHEGSKCDMDKMFHDLARIEKWRPCPHCSIYVERSGGCCLMKCRCGFVFCYGCGSKWGFFHACPFMI